MYVPSKKILDKYADVLVNYALNSGRGVEKGDVVFLLVPECAKPLLIALRRAVLKSDAFPIIRYLPDGISREYFECASDKQLKFFPSKYVRGIVDEADHSIAIIAETDKHELVGVDPKKIMMRNVAYKPYMDWRDEKENAGKFTWTLALYGTSAMAKEVGMSEKIYWNEIIKACYLDVQDPIAKWKSIQRENNRLKKKLTKMNIQSLNVKAEGTDLTIGLGLNRKWLGGSGNNIPSFEVFISPDYRKTQGYISFDQPLYRYGNLIEDVRLEFIKGEVTKATAKKGQKILREMIKVKNADRLGEFSLTDGRMSRITKFMGETLYNENRGGRYGNTHIALGSAYKDSYTGDPSKVIKAQWARMGYNDSVIHTDIVATTNRIVTATLEDGEERIIYKDGKFVI